MEGKYFVEAGWLRTQLKAGEEMATPTAPTHILDPYSSYAATKVFIDVGSTIWEAMARQITKAAPPRPESKETATKPEKKRRSRQERSGQSVEGSPPSSSEVDEDPPLKRQKRGAKSKPEASTTSCAPPKYDRFANEVVVGDVVDARDNERKWFKARVVEAEDDEVKLHYVGWSARFDGWVSRLGRRIVPHGVMTRVKKKR